MNARLGVLWLATALLAVAQPVPSHWKGTATGEVHGRAFRLPMTIEIAAPLPLEQNPFHLFPSSDSANRDEATRLGSFLLKSAGGVLREIGRQGHAGVLPHHEVGRRADGGA